MLASLVVRELLIRFSRKGGRAIQQQAIELHTGDNGRFLRIADRHLSHFKGLLLARSDNQDKVVNADVRLYPCQKIADRLR